MKNFLWKVIANIVCMPWVTNWIIRKARQTPYLHIIKDGRIYMERYWLFNPYDNATRKAKYPWIPFSIRIHFIHRPDEDKHLHDHPWNARTIILRGWYLEEKAGIGWPMLRMRGDTATLGVRQYHRIKDLGSRPPVTLFISGQECNKWGYLVDGHHVTFKEYRKLEVASDIRLLQPKL